MQSDNAAISLEQVGVSFGDVVAIQNLSFAVGRANRRRSI